MRDIAHFKFTQTDIDALHEKFPEWEQVPQPFGFLSYCPHFLLKIKLTQIRDSLFFFFLLFFKYVFFSTSRAYFLLLCICNFQSGVSGLFACTGYEPSKRVCHRGGQFGIPPHPAHAHRRPARHLPGSMETKTHAREEINCENAQDYIYSVFFCCMFCMFGGFCKQC